MHAYLLRTHIKSNTLFSLLLLLPNSEHNLEPSIKRNLNLLRHQLIILPSHAKPLPSFRMTDNHPRASDIHQLTRANLTRKSAALIVDAAVLRRDLNVVPEGFQGHVDVDKRHAHDNFGVLRYGSTLVDGFDEILRGFDGAVAFPVAADKVLALSFLNTKMCG